jgi:hypothetical protein
MAHCRDLNDAGIPKHLPLLLRAMQRRRYNANVTVDYEKLGVNGTIHTYFP